MIRMLRDIANSPFMFLVYTAVVIYGIDAAIKGYCSPQPQPQHQEGQPHDVS